MPPKRQYSKYLWDSSVEVPHRSKCRFKQRELLGAPSASRADGDSDESGDESSSYVSNEEQNTAGVTDSISGACAGENAHSRSRSCEWFEGAFPDYISSDEADSSDEPDSSDEVDDVSPEESEPEPHEPESHEASPDERTGELVTALAICFCMCGELLN
ncbi:hypothetical protein V5799_011917 [Amblyomma americanum]|uniref:Uncharacterized protein n=1 Tax=Amblyomma americanum TaxID=6943 RepID=A0AAQ4EFJ2_AMBAM